MAERDGVGLKRLQFTIKKSMFFGFRPAEEENLQCFFRISKGADSFVAAPITLCSKLRLQDFLKQSYSLLT